MLPAAAFVYTLARCVWQTRLNTHPHVDRAIRHPDRWQFLSKPYTDRARLAKQTRASFVFLICRTLFDHTPLRHNLLFCSPGMYSHQKCAIESAKYGKSVCIVDKSSQIGGVCVHTGTIPSKTFR